MTLLLRYYLFRQQAATKMKKSSLRTLGAETLRASRRQSREVSIFTAEQHTAIQYLP